MDHGQSGHLGQVVQGHVAVGNDHVIEHSLGMMIEYLLKLKQKTVIQVGYSQSVG